MDFIKAVFTGDWESAWDAISNIFGNIFDTIGKIFGGIWEFFETSFKTFSTNFEKVWDGLWKGIGNFFIGIWNGIVGAFESAINWIIGGINDVLKAINTMTGFASDLLEKVGINISFQISEIPKISFGKVPKLANGGVLKRSTIIAAGEYTGASNNPEIVAPQSLMYETSLKAQQAANQPVIVLLQRLIQSVDKGHVIEADGYNLGRLVSRTQNNNNVLLGI